MCLSNLTDLGSKAELLLLEGMNMDENVARRGACVEALLSKGLQYIQSILASLQNQPTETEDQFVNLILFQFDTHDKIKTGVSKINPYNARVKLKIKVLINVLQEKFNKGKYMKMFDWLNQLKDVLNIINN